MTRRSKHRKEHTPSATPVFTFQPVKVLALGVGVLLVFAALMNLVLSTTASPFGNGAREPSVQAVGGTLAPINNGVQEVSLSMKGYEYQPNPIRVKVGVPVKMTVDLSTVRGCMRSIQIPELGVSGRVSDGNNIITFTPTQAGTFRMTCSMGMADGTIIVEDATGQAPAAAPSAAKPLGGGSCGSGGCGCGG
jgi:plastocyanin